MDLWRLIFPPPKIFTRLKIFLKKTQLFPSHGQLYPIPLSLHSICQPHLPRRRQSEEGGGSRRRGAGQRRHSRSGPLGMRLWSTASGGGHRSVNRRRRNWLSAERRRRGRLSAGRWRLTKGAHGNSQFSAGQCGFLYAYAYLFYQNYGGYHLPSY